MIVYLVKNEVGQFVPANMSDAEKADSYKVGDTVKAEIKKPRNIKFHRKFFGLLNLVFENLPEGFYIETPNGHKVKITSVDHLLRIVKYGVGLYDIEINIDGEVSTVLKSISFAKMDEAEFSNFYDRVFDFLVTDVLKGDNEIITMLRDTIAAEC